MERQMPADAARLASPRARGREGWEKQDEVGSGRGRKVILGHVKCVPDHADHGQESGRMPYEDRRCLLGGAQVETASQRRGEMGPANAWMDGRRRSLTRPITAPDKGNQARRMGPLPVCLGLPCGSWTRPACARGGSGGGRPPAAHPLAANRPKRGSPRQLRWPGMDCWLPLCRHPTPGEAAMPNGKPTD